MPKETQLNFPLCLLSFNDNVQDRLNHIISYSIVDYTHTLEKLNNEIIEYEFDFVLDEEKIPNDYKPDNELHKMILISCRRKGINVGNIKSTITRYKKVQTHHKRSDTAQN